MQWPGLDRARTSRAVRTADGGRAAMIRLCIIGAGGHSRSNHGPSLRQYKAEHPAAVELAAVCDLDAEKAGRYAADFGFARTQTDMHAMIDAESPDGLLLITPIALTAKTAADLLPHRLPLLIEKPPGASLAEAEQLLAAVERHDAPVMVSFNRRFSPAILRANQWLRDHAAGRPPQWIAAEMLRTKRCEEQFVRGTLIHSVDTVLSFLGRPAQVSSRRWTGAGGAQCAQALLEFESGAGASILCAPAAGAVRETYELIGPEYCIRIDTHRCRLRVWSEGAEVLTWQAADDCPPHVVGGAMAETESFIEAVAAGTGFSPSLADAVASMRAAQAIDAGGG